MTSEIITGYHHDIGGREVYEDRVKAQKVQTAGELDLAVAVVADGVGGRDKGERASQLAIDAVFKAIEDSTEADVPSILHKAAKVANRAVHQETQKYEGTSTTLVMAAILNGERLFIANVGDSRVYLCRKDKVTQLTIDHTFANMMPMNNKMSWELARENPRADVVMRALGPKGDVPVDLGFYVGTTDMNTANSRGRKGLPLEPGDSILVCSDGLIKEDRNGQPFITHEEITRVVNSQEGDVAARSLVSFALGRDADDNVSAALLQTHDPSRQRRAFLANPRTIAAIAGVIALLIIIIVGVLLSSNASTQVANADATRAVQAAIEASNLQATSTSAATTATAEAINLNEQLEVEGITREAGVIGTATANAATLEADTIAENTRIAATATQLALAGICNSTTAYNFVVSDKPQLQPNPTYVHVIGNPFPRIEATWTLTNTGQCPLRAFQLRSLQNSNEFAALSEEVSPNIASGDTTEIIVTFPQPGSVQDLDEEWIVVVESDSGTFSLFDQAHFVLQPEEPWIRLENPTPTFTPTPLPTDTPEPTPSNSGGGGNDGGGNDGGGNDGGGNDGGGNDGCPPNCDSGRG